MVRVSSTPLPPLVRFSGEPDEVVDRVLDGRYRIDGVLGRGAMAVVLAARHVFLDAPVAVKILHPGLTALPEMRARFLREARVTNVVDHEGLVRVSDFGVTAEGLHYLVMEQLEGEDLLAWSSRRGAADADECARIAVSVCEALTALHAAGYVHRDLKPENLWVLPDGDRARAPTVKLLDLGIAGLIEGGFDARVGRHRLEDKRLTQAGQTLGTALYMSPEQTLGNALDARSDLYALGCVLWELATDRCAFEGVNTVDIMMKQVSEVPPPPSTINPALPPWFDRLVMKLLAKRPEDRFQSAAETARAFAAELSPTARKEAAKAPRVARDRRWLWGGLGVAVATLFVAMWISSRSEPTATTRSGRAVSAWAVATGLGPPAFLAAEAGPVESPSAAGLAPAALPPESIDAQLPGDNRRQDDLPRSEDVKKPARGARVEAPRPAAKADLAPPTAEAPRANDGLWQPALPETRP